MPIRITPPISQIEAIIEVQPTIVFPIISTKKIHVSMQNAIKIAPPLNIVINVWVLWKNL